VWGRARSAGARLLQRRAARAFSAWVGARRARIGSLEKLGAPSRRWLYPRKARAWRTWVHRASRRGRLRRATAAVLLRGSRLALNQWQRYTRTLLQALGVGLGLGLGLGLALALR
jgi:hypothetical protein